MTTITKEFTKEQLIEQAKNNLIGLKNYVTVYPERAESEAMNIRLAEIALASLEAKPVAWTDEEELRDANVAEIGYLFGIEKDANKFADPRRQIMLYRHAQPVPVVPPAIEPDYEVIKAILPTSNPDEYACCIAADMWNACRSAMLQAGNSPVSPDGYVLVPKKLTAENGAKCVLSGEFSETKFINCPECFGDDECETCDGSGRIEITVPVTWTTIKAIWTKGVEHFAAAPQQEVK